MSVAEARDRLDDAVRLPWSRQVLADEDGRFIASVPELDGCFADGETPQEALETLDEVLHGWLAIAIEEGRDLPEPRRLEADMPSGRFSVRLPRSLHRRLVEAAERERSSLNQLVNVLLARGLEEAARGGAAEPTVRYRPDGTWVESEEAARGGAAEPPVEDAHENLAALAVRSSPQAIGPLKGIARFVEDRGDVNVACLLYGFASIRIEEAEGPQEAARNLGMAAALARRHGRAQLAEALFRESLRRDPTDLRSRSGLGQALHHQGRYREAIECLEPAASVDNYARLFLGWSRLLAGLEDDDDEAVEEAWGELGEALRNWAYNNGDRRDRERWMRQIQRLRALGTRFAGHSRQLIEFANANAAWGEIDVTVIDEPWSSEEDMSVLASESSGLYE